MKRQISDPCFPNDSDFSSLYRVVVDAAPVGTHPEGIDVLYGEASDAIVAEGCWTGPNGATYVALFHARWDDMIVGYRKFREKDWFTRENDIVLGPYRTKRAAIKSIGATTSEIVSAGHYKANSADIFTRDMAERVIGEGVLCS